MRSSEAILTLILPSEQSDHARTSCAMQELLARRENIIENGSILKGNEAKLLGRALKEVKAKFYEKSETSLDDTQALNALVSCFRTVQEEEKEKETRHAYLNPLR